MHKMHIKDLDLNLVSVFDALLRERNVTLAADAIGLSQSAMSHALRRLRIYFNDPLFVRTANGMAPTPRALELGDTVLSIVELVREQLVPKAGFDPAKSNRTFALCLTDMGELVFLPTIMKLIGKLAPACRIKTIQVPQKEIKGVLESGEADLAVGSIYSVPGELFQQRLFTHPFVCIASSKNRKIGKILTLDHYQDASHVAVSLTGRTEDAYDRVIDDYGINRKVVLMTPHFLVVPLLIENTDLIATVPRELGTVFSRYKCIKVWPTPIELPRFDLRQHWHPRFHHDSANKWLRKLIHDAFKNYPE
ncbi:MAG: LysR family transcriptional regulator [Proteobacteria bacterium]|nr:LysR family transcriptional regulator [Pseudomonadota bacterium]